MSIIYDALKKLEGNDESENSSGEVILDKDSGKPGKSKRPSNRKILFILIGLLTATVLIFSFSVGRQYLLEKAASLFSLIKKGDLSDQQKSLGFNPLLSSKESPKLEETGAYRLDGIIYDLDFPIAIINGNSFKREELIGEYKIVEITKSTVELVNAKDETKLILSIEF